MQNMSLKTAVRIADTFVTSESRRTARFLDTLTRRNVSLSAYEADPGAYWHPSGAASPSEKGKGHGRRPRR